MEVNYDNKFNFIEEKQKGATEDEKEQRERNVIGGAFKDKYLPVRYNRRIN